MVAAVDLVGGGFGGVKCKLEVIFQVFGSLRGGLVEGGHDWSRNVHGVRGTEKKILWRQVLACVLTKRPP